MDGYRAFTRGYGKRDSANFEQRPYFDMTIFPTQNSFGFPEALHHGDCRRAVNAWLGFDDFCGEHAAKHIRHRNVKFNVSIGNRFLGKLGHDELKNGFLHGFSSRRKVLYFHAQLSIGIKVLRRSTILNLSVYQDGRDRAEQQQSNSPFGLHSTPSFT